jgi:D-threo-aldose 1-dehydrogenase
VLTGCRSVDELEENVRMFETPIPDDLWAELLAENLLPRDAPVPATHGATTA